MMDIRIGGFRRPERATPSMLALEGSSPSGLSRLGFPEDRITFGETPRVSDAALLYAAFHAPAFARLNEQTHLSFETESSGDGIVQDPSDAKLPEYSKEKPEGHLTLSVGLPAGYTAPSPNYSVAEGGAATAPRQPPRADERNFHPGGG
jgi:hypothetical protein